MTNKPGWLPNLILISDYDGDWDKYIETLYRFFRRDFFESKPSFRNVPVGITKHPYSQGKEATFWHLISEGKIEEERIPDFERCKRIRWPRAIIENYSDSVVQVWETMRGREKRILLRFIFEKDDYLVVLAEHKGMILLITAYLVTWQSQKRKLQQEFERYKADTAL
ncbi:MAG TPA: hypothetical protein PKV01_09405 [Anaerolineales bacterium]|nr:hypothetical protein [Anaerolineales bacterium]